MDIVGVGFSGFIKLGDSWYFRLVSNLKRSLRNEKQFLYHVDRLCGNQLVHVHCLE